MRWDGVSVPSDWRAGCVAEPAGRLDGGKDVAVSRAGPTCGAGAAGCGLLAANTASESDGAVVSALGPAPSSSMSAIFSSSVRRCAEPGAAALSASDKLA
jgi:hypothetical protein